MDLISDFGFLFNSSFTISFYFYYYILAIVFLLSLKFTPMDRKGFLIIQFLVGTRLRCWPTQGANELDVSMRKTTNSQPRSYEDCDRETGQRI